MKKIALLISICFLNFVDAQIKKPLNETCFDEKLATEQAIFKGMKPSEIKGYIQSLKNEFSSKKALTGQKHFHSLYETNNVQENIIYLNPNKTYSLDCPNMGFENNNFSGWTGSYGTVAMGASGSAYPSYMLTSSTIVNTAGNNVSLVNTTNYHTIMNTPALNAFYPNCSGYDSIACKTVGTNTISQIPVVSPFSSDGSSVRMNGANANYRACKLKYITTTSSTNKKLSYSFALVMNNAGHLPEESPYFKVEVRNETNGQLVSGCNSSITIVSPSIASDSMFVSSIGFGDVMCKKWKLYTIDLSALPIGTNVSINFEVGGCSQGGHWGYAYVDAECGAVGSSGGNDFISSNMCPGSNFAELIAPLGYISYQWFNPNSTQITGATSNTLSVANPTLGNIYSVQLTGNNGCIETKTVSITTSSISVTNITSTGSCFGSNIGSATVNTNGSNGAISYTWTSINTGSIVSNSQTAINLSPGNYSVNISSGTCGQTTATINVPISPPSFNQQSKTFCNNNTFITTNPGSNHQWYMGMNPIPAPNGTNDTLFINNAINGYDYTVVYTNNNNCKDSIRYILNQVTGGFLNTSNSNVCLGNTNGSVQVNLYPINQAPYTYSIKDNNGIISSSVSSSTLFTSTNLSAGTYTCTVADGNCTYNNTFTVSAISTNFTMTPSYNNGCSSSDTARINFSFGDITSGTCALDPSICSNSSQTILFPSGPYTQNGPGNYPTPYGNYYTYGRTQYLITASDLNTAGIYTGRISSLAFKVLNLNSSITNYPNFYIKMGCTSISTFSNLSSGVGQSFVAGMQTVYSNTNQSVTLGWQTYNFSESYIWDGTSNIIVEVCFGMNSPSNYSQNITVELKQLAYVATLSHVEDALPVCNGTQLADNYSMLPNGQYMVPNMRFGHCSLNSPSSYTISVSSNGNIVQNYNNDSIKIVPVTTPTADIVYTITVTNPEGGCTSSQTFTMSSSLSAYTTYTNASCGSCADGSAQVNVNCGTGPYSYLWSPGGQTTQLASGLLPGCYTVTVTDASLNSTTNQVCISFVTKLEESSTLNGLSIFPNPSNGIFNIYSESNIESLNVSIINTLGQNIFSETQKNTSHMQIDLSKMSRGVYYLKAHTNSGTKLFKLIIE